MAEETRGTVLVALLANVGVGVAKGVGGVVTGSSALLAEAAHSVADTLNEAFLLLSLSRADRPADRTHPFGYGKERFFWSLLAAGAIFVSGAAFSFFQGIETILSSGEPTGELWINYPVLAIAAVLEGISLRQAAVQMNREAKRLRRSVRSVLRLPRDPTVNSVLLEDSAAIIGLATAALGVALHQITGEAFYDGAASLVIGALLLSVTFVLVRSCRTLLIGQQADPRLIRAIEEWLEEQPEVDDVVDLLTMLTGTETILLCARVDFVDATSGSDLEQACVRLDTEMREKWEMLDEIFIQPASRKDVGMRRRVEARYGQALAEE